MVMVEETESGDGRFSVTGTSRPVSCPTVAMMCSADHVLHRTSGHLRSTDTDEACPRATIKHPKSAPVTSARSEVEGRQPLYFTCTATEGEAWGEEQARRCPLRKDGGYAYVRGRGISFVELCWVMRGKGQGRSEAGRRALVASELHARGGSAMKQREVGENARCSRGRRGPCCSSPCLCSAAARERR